MSTIHEIIAAADSGESSSLATLVEPIRLGGRSETKHKKVLVHADNAFGIFTVLHGQVYLIPWHRVESLEIPVPPHEPQV